MSDEVQKDEFFPTQPLGRDLRREDFTVERVRRIADAIAARGGVPFMSDEARRASLKAIRESVPSGHDAWVVGKEPVVVIDFQGMVDYAKQKK